VAPGGRVRARAEVGLEHDAPVGLAQEDRPHREPRGAHAVGERVVERVLGVELARERVGDVVEHRERRGLERRLPREVGADGRLPVELARHALEVLGLHLGVGRRNRRGGRGRAQYVEHAAHERPEALRAAEVAVGAEAQRERVVVLFEVVRGDEHHGRGGERGVRAQRRAELKAVHSGHEHVAQHDVGVRLARDPQGLLTRGGHERREPLGRERELRELALDGVVVDHEHHAPRGHIGQRLADRVVAHHSPSEARVTRRAMVCRSASMSTGLATYSSHPAARVRSSSPRAA